MRTFLMLFGIALFAAGLLVGGTGALGFMLTMMAYEGSRLLPSAVLVIAGMILLWPSLFLLLRNKDRMGMVGRKLVFGGLPLGFAGFFVWAMLLPDISGQWLMGLLAAAFALLAVCGFRYTPLALEAASS